MRPARRAEQFDVVNADVSAWMQAKIQNADAVYKNAETQFNSVFWISTAGNSAVVLDRRLASGRDNTQHHPTDRKAESTPHPASPTASW